jgi:hypothetical protein
VGAILTSHIATTKLVLAILVVKRSEDGDLFVGVAAEPGLERLLGVFQSIGVVLVLGLVELFEALAFAPFHPFCGVEKLAFAEMGQQLGRGWGGPGRHSGNRVVSLLLEPLQIVFAHAVAESFTQAIDELDVAGQLFVTMPLVQLTDDALGGGLVLSAEVEGVDHATCDDAPSEIVADLAQATARQKQSHYEPTK